MRLIILAIIPAALFGQTGASQVSTKGAGAGSVNRSVQSKLNDIINVMDYGAVGNNIHDDTANINAAALAGAIMLPCGQFKTSGPITLNANSPTIIGNSPNNNHCTTFINNASGAGIRYYSPVSGSQGDAKGNVRIENITMFATKNAIELNNPTIPTAPGAYQQNLINPIIRNVVLIGPYVQASDPNAFTAVVPTISQMVNFGVGISCTQCFGLKVEDSIIQQFGVGIYCGCDESKIMGNRITNNGNASIIYPAASGATNFTQGNNNVFFANKFGGNLRVGEIRLNNAVGATKITHNYFENYCPSSTFLLSQQSYGTTFAMNEMDNPNNSGLCSQVSYGTNSTALLNLDDVRDIYVYGNHMLENGSSVPGITYGNTYGNNFQYHVYDNTNGFPSNPSANTIYQGTTKLPSFYISDAGPALTGGNGSLFLGDGTIAKSPGSGFNFGGTGISVGNVFSTGPTQSGSFATIVNCVSSASPAVCSSAAAGSFNLPAAATTVTVNTTAVNANSQIIITPDSSLGTRLGVTCNTTVPSNLQVSARVAATSFTITGGAPTTNPACFNFSIIN